MTGCGNILDDEYKKTLETELPEHGVKFRSVLDILVSDRYAFSGKVQRVSVARAMAHTPQVLLADETTVSLDTDTGRDLVQIMFSIGRGFGCTMVIATHDPEIIT